MRNVKKLFLFVLLMMLPALVNAANRISCTYDIKGANGSVGTLNISVDDSFNLNASGSGSMADSHYSFDSSMNYNHYLNTESGVLECGVVRELYMALSGTNRYKICYSESNCDRGGNQFTLSLSSSSSSSDSKEDDDSSEATNNSGSQASNNGGSGSSNNSCNPTSGLGPTLIFIGHIVRIAKILIPLVIIVMGIMDFFRAITAGKDDEIKKSTKSFVWRLVAGVVIFFLPALISLVFSWIPEWEGYDGSFQQCFKCVWDVGSCK